MKALLRKINSSSLSLDNTHLQNILENNEFIEIGNIQNKVMSNLVNGKLVKLEDLSYFQIQNIGLGSSEFETVNVNTLDDNDELKSKLPFVELNNKINNHSSMIAIITYGILVQRINRKNFASHEEFTPMVILPVQMFVEDNIYFQMISLPFVNPYISTIRKVNVHGTSVENLNTLNSIDRFCLSYNNFADVRLECYVSYINLKSNKANFINRYFNEGVNLYNVDHRYNIKDNNVLYISMLNKAQRNILEKAHMGHSFEIAGNNGTGKTTALINVAADAIYNGKRVLYLSSSIDTLKQVYAYYEERNLSGVVSPLYKPFNELKEKYNRPIHVKKDYEELREKIVQELDGYYEQNDKYIGLLYKRINNYYCIDVLNQCIKYRDYPQNIPLEYFEGISKIYHEEVDGVLAKLSLIDDNINKIESIKNSIFNNIPLYIETTSEIIVDVLTKMSDSYKKVEKLIDELANQYGCVKVNNYAFFRAFLNNYHMLDKNLISEEWIKYNENGLYEFQKAKQVLQSFKEEMNLRSEKQKVLEDNYDCNALNEIDLLHDIPFIFDHYKGYDNKTVNRFLKDNDKIIENLKIFIDSIPAGEENFTLMNKAIRAKIDFSNDALVEQILSFMMFIYKNNYSIKWLLFGKTKENMDRIEELKKILDQYDEDKKAVGIVDTRHLSEYIDSLKLRSFVKFKDGKLKLYIKKVEKLFEDSKTIDVVYNEYQDYTGSTYSYEANPIKEYERFLKLLESINNDKVRKGIADLLMNSPIHEVREKIKPFIDFGEYFIQLNQKYRMITGYSLCADRTGYMNKINDIKEVYNYCIKVKEIQEKIRHCIKEKKYYILLEDISLIRLRINDLKKIEESIDHNEEYHRLLGKCYVGCQSNVRDIERVFTRFEKYTSDFTTNKAIENSFVTPFALNEKMSECSDLVEDIIETIKNYTRYFKESVERFYYSDIQDIYHDIDSLITKKEELSVYLNLIQGLNGLTNFGLEDLSKYIYENNDKEINYKETFNKEYFDNLLKMFKIQNPYSYEIEENYQLLEKIVNKENELINNNIEDFASWFKTKFTISSLKNMDYQDYMEKTIGIKYLFLATPLVFNYFLEASNFDLVLIDDAQILDSNENIKALLTKQVIAAGVPQVSFGITDDLMSNMKRLSTIRLNYRYYASPLSIMRFEKRFKSNIQSKYNDNKGTIYSKLDLTRVFEEIARDNGKDILNIRINVFLEENSLVKDLYDRFAETLAEQGFLNGEIIKYLAEKVNVSSIARHHGLEGDYNIVRMSDYIDCEDQYDAANYMNLITTVRRKLVICDEEGVLENNKLKCFASMVKGISEREIKFNKNYQDESIQKIIQRLRQLQIEIMGSVGNYGLVLKQGGMLYGLVFFDLESLHESNVLNLYRNHYYHGYIPTLFLYLFDIEQNFDDCINKILVHIGLPKIEKPKKPKNSKKAKRNKNKRLIYNMNYFEMADDTSDDGDDTKEDEENNTGSLGEQNE